MSIKLRIIAPAILTLGAAGGIAAPVVASVAPAAPAVVAAAPMTHYAG